MSALLETKDRVQTFLTELGPVNIDGSGQYSLRNGSTRVFVSVSELSEDSTWVRLLCPLLNDVNESPELHQHVAFNSDQYKYGTLGLSKDDDGKCHIWLGYGLLGDTLDPDELKRAVVMLASTADDLDDELQGRFGGNRFYED